MNKKLTLIFLSLIFFMAVAESQTMKAYEESAKEAVENKDFGSAAYYYWTMVEDAETSDIQHIFDAAEAARKYRSYRFAESWYIKVLDSEKKADYPTAWFGLGTVRKSLGKYELAKEAFTSYLSLNPNGIHAEQAHKEINDCDAVLAMNIDFVNGDSSIIHLDERVNTKDSEVSALRIGENLYYTSYRFKGEDKDPEYCCRFGKNLLSVKEAEGQPLESEFNDSTRHTINGKFDSEQKRIYFNSCHNINASEVRCEILYRELDEKGAWGAPVRLSDRINMDGYTATQPTVGLNSNNGKTYLFFSSDRPEGKGGMDIWCSVMGDNGEFSAPFNIEAFNTDKDDITPFYHAASDRLFFSSNGRQSMGGFDIYFSTYSNNGSYGNDGSWSGAEALDYPVNTSFDEAYYSLSTGLPTPKGYFSSNRPGTFYRDTLSEFSCNDIFSYDIRIDLQVLTFNAVDSLTEWDSCTVRLVDLTSGKEKAITNLEGHDFEFANLEAEHEYMIIGNRVDYVTSKGYIADTLTFNTFGVYSSKKIVKKLYLMPKITLQVLTYVSDKVDTFALAGCKVKLFDISTQTVVLDSLIPLNSNTSLNEFIHQYLLIGHRYRITGTREFYSEQQALVNLGGDLSKYLRPQTVTRKLYFKCTLSDFELLQIYFHNDVPGPRNNRDTISTINYLTAHNSYTALKPTYVGKFKDGNAEKDKITRFFNGPVEGGMTRLKQFADTLNSHLQNQQVKIKVNIEGYASKRSNPVYNLALTKRRVSSVKKYLGDTYPVLDRAIREKRLELILIGYGDSKSEELTNVTVKSPVQYKKDPIRSIYTEAASRERRVEIKNFEIYKNGVRILCPSNY